MKVLPYMSTRRFPLHRTFVRALGALLVVALTAPMAFAQSVSDPSNPPPDDDPLYACKKRTGDVAVTFKPETELKDLITWVMGFTCKNFILDPRVVSTGKKITVIAPNKMSASQAYQLFLVSLSTMGLTVVPKGNVLRIVESSTSKSETVPIYTKGLPPNQDQLVRFVMRPTHTSAETLRGAFDAIRSPAGSVQAFGDIIMITDYGSQIRDMITLSRAIDVPGGSDGIYTIAVKYADAAALAQKLNEILGVSAQGQPAAATPQRGRGAPRTEAAPQVTSAESVSSAVPSKILVDDRTNTLIIVSSEAGYLRVKALVDRLDVSLDTEGGTAIRVHPLENALAENTLNSAPGLPRTGQGGPTPMPSPVGDLGSSLEGSVRVIGDKPTNSLIILASGRDYLAIKDVIRRLDQPRRQVFIEALILEVQLAKDFNLGTSSHGGAPFNNGDLVVAGVQTPALRSLNVASLATLTGLVGGLIGSPLENSQTLLGTSIPSYGILFQALATQNNSNILSAPHVIAIDNEKAELSVGNNIPYKAGLTFGGFGLPTTGNNQTLAGSIGQNIQREKLNLTLNVTPHISSNDAIRLEIEQETKDLGGQDPELGPTWTERKLKTQVVVNDQQTVVIGGLIQEKDIYSTTKVPLLGDIPLLGYLFKYSQKSKQKTNLLIMLTPYIIKDQLDLQAIRERKAREREEFVRSFAVLNEMKYIPTTDYRRKRGLLEEINRSVQAVEQDLEVLRAMGQRQQVQDGALQYSPTPAEDAGSAPGASSGAKEN
jgi:general secretion pathway protein D